MNAPLHGTVLKILKSEEEAVHVFDFRPAIIVGNPSQLRVRAVIDERFGGTQQAGQMAAVYGRGLGDRRFAGVVVLVKQLMGDKTVFSRDAAERKDLDVRQAFIESATLLASPVGLRVDVESIKSALAPPTAADSGM